MKYLEQHGGAMRETRMGDEEPASCDCCQQHSEHRAEIVRCAHCHKACTCACHEGDPNSAA